MPNDIKANGEEGRPIIHWLIGLGIGINPWMALCSENEVKNSILGIKDDGENHANRDSIGNIRHEEKGLERLFKDFNRI